MRSLLIVAVLFLQGLAAPQTQYGTISGRLDREDGNAAAGIRVAAMTLADGALTSFAQTGGDGRFQITDVPQGRYYITAGPVTDPVFFPGVFGSAGATIVTVAPGMKIEGVNFTLAAKGASIRGRVVGAENLADDIRAALRVTVSHVRRGGGGQGIVRPSRIGTVDNAGRFEIVDIPPDNYSIQLSPSPGYTQPSSLTVDRDDIDGLRISLPNLLRGRVVLEEGGALPAPARLTQSGPTGIGFSTFDCKAPMALAPPETGVVLRATPIGWATAPVQRDGAFFVPLPDGECSVRVLDIPIAYRVKEILYGSVDLTRVPLKFLAPSSPDIRVVLEKARGVKVSGRVTNIPADGSPGPLFLNLSSRELPYRGELRFDRNGTFEFENVLPGSWTLSLGASILGLKVADKDILDVEISNRELLQISGRVRFNDSRGAQLATAPSGVSLVLRGEPTFSVDTLPVKPDGTVLGRILEGEYSFYLSGEGSASLRVRPTIDRITINRASPTFEIIADANN